MLTLALVALAAAPVTAPAKRPVVTVLYFDNLTGLPGYDVLQKGLADMMVTDLVASEAVDVVERERFQAVVAELKLQRSRYFDPATAQQLGKAVGASHAVTGTIMAVEPAVRLSVRVVELGTAKVLVSEEVTGPKDALFELQQRLVALLLRSLNVKLGVAPQVKAAGSVDALLSYAHAVDLADTGQLALAAARISELLEKAPGFELAQERRVAFSRRLKAAGDTRRQQQERAWRGLVARAELVTATTKPMIELADLQAARHLTYRLLAVLCAGLELKNKLTPTAVHSIPEGQEAEVRALLQTYRQRLAALERDVATWRGPWRWLPDPEDKPALELLQLGVSEPALLNGNAAEVRAWHAELVGRGVVLGKPGGVVMRPTLTELEPALLDEALRLYDDAIAAFTASKGPDAAERVVTLMDHKAQALALVGKKEAAVRVWQDALERFPQNKQFEVLEARVNQAAGLDGPSRAEAEKVRALAKAVAVCEPEAVQRLFPTVLSRMVEKDGLWSAKPLVAQLERQCGAVAAFRPALLSALALTLELAEKQSDCGYFDRVFAAYRRFNSSGADALRAEHPGCD